MPGHPEVVGTMGQLPPGCGGAGETLPRMRRCSRRAIRRACLCHADHAVRRRHRRNRRAPQGALSRDRRAAQGGHLLRHHQSPGGGEAGRAAGRGDDRGRRAEFVELAAAQGGRRARRLPARGAGATRERHRLVVFGAIRSLGITAGASAPEVLVEEIIDAFAGRYAVRVETVSAADEGMFFPLPRQLRENAAAE